MARFTRRLQPFRYLHSCSGCFRLEHFTGWESHPLENAALARRTPKADVISRCDRFTRLPRNVGGHGNALPRICPVTAVLSSIGGCGKTRLALELAGAVLPSFHDGVWFVDLAAVADHERLPMTIAATLEIRKQVGSETVVTLCNHLSSRQMLLVLDNCEHLTSACAQLTQRLLDAAPLLRIVATSREGLNVPGERTVTVRSLKTPEIGLESDPQALQRSEAARLLVGRARSVDRTFCVDASTASAVAEICRRLDGIPLALELAAARVRVLSAEEIRRRLDDRFRLLTSGRAQTLLDNHARLHRCRSVPRYRSTWTRSSALFTQPRPM